MRSPTELAQGTETCLPRTPGEDMPSSREEEEGTKLAPSPALGGAERGNGSPLVLRSTRFGFGTKDEAFFDSQGWLESDCEDDFFSVDGDFTPSHSSSPNFQTGTTRIKLQLHKTASILDGFFDTSTEPSLRKTLAELLQEAMSGEPAEDEHNTVGERLQVNEKLESNKMIMDQLLHSSDGTTYLATTNSTCSGERTTEEGFRSGEGKRKKAMQCCLPNLVHSLNFNEKKQTPRMSPWHHSGG